MHGNKFPSIGLLTHNNWSEASWSGTTFRWHPTSEAPPVMGLVFDNTTAAQAIFNQWSAGEMRDDAYDQLHVSILEGEFAGSTPGYLIHLCPNHQGIEDFAAAHGIDCNIEQYAGLCQANKMDFLPDTPQMLSRFKEEFAKHQEFLLAPVTRHDDGQMYVDTELGIIKYDIDFLSAEDVINKLKDQGLDTDTLRTNCGDRRSQNRRITRRIRRWSHHHPRWKVSIAKGNC